MNGTVLVIEDDKRVQDVLEIQLSGLGYRVIQAVDGISGLERFLRDPVEAVILDINLPGLNGRDVLARIREAGRPVPVIVLTGYTDLDLAVELMHQGAFYYLTKPVNRKHLATQLQRALEHRRLLVEKERLEAENRRYQEHLEQMVEERTAELRRTTQRLMDLQEQLAQADKAASLELVLSSVVHEVKNPLTVVSSYTDLLMEEAGEASRWMLEAIAEACVQIRTLLEQLRDVGRQHPFELEQFDLREVLDTIAALTRVHCTRAGVEVAVEQRCPARLRADRRKLQQVLLNLVLNACHAMPEGGKLHLRIRESDEPGHCILEVEDTGVGILPDQLDDVLRPFFTTRGDQGTGLGLSIAREIVERHGGFLVVDSTPGRGTRMAVCLPEDGPGG